MAGTLTRRNFLSLDFGDRKASGDHWVRVHRVAMACRFEVMLPSDDAINVEAARAALDEADEIDSLLTVFRDGGETAELNHRAAAEAVVVSDGLFDILQRSAALSAATGGAFDVTSAPLDRCWEFLRQNGHVPDDVEIEEARAIAGMQHVILDRTAGTVTFARQGVEIHFGQIGKGYALDRMADVLRARGARRALLSAGRSSVLAIGGRGRGWPVDLWPRLASRTGRLWVRNGAVGMSGAGEPFTVVDGQRYGNVIDPRTGHPADGVLAASAVARDAATAEALSAAFLVGGPALAESYCTAHPGTMAILVLDKPDEPTTVFGRYDGATLEDLP